MTAGGGVVRVASQDELKELESVALQEHISLGIEHPSDVMLQIRIRSLAVQRGLLVPGMSQPSRLPIKKATTQPPNYMGASLEQQAQQCAQDRRAAKLKKHIQIVRKNSDRFYLFCFLKGGFACEMSNCHALEVLTAIIEQLCGDVETWVSLATLADRLGRTRKTVAKALQRLEEKRIVSLTDANSRVYSVNGKLIQKNQGYVIMLHAPMLWDWNSIGGVPDWMKKYLADYEDEYVEM